MTAHAPANPTQVAFRVLVQAMAHPGRTYDLGPACAAAGASPLPTIAGCLLDHECSFAVVGDGADELREHIFRACKATPVAPTKADYVFILGAESGGIVSVVQRGDLRFPDRGATLIYALPEGAVSGAVLSGPGVDGEMVPEMGGLDPKELAALREVNAEFPLGCDCLFVDPGRRVMAIPRSTTIAGKV